VPELPEVETVARQLAPMLAGRTLRSVRIVDPKLDNPDLLADLPGRPVEETTRMGKQVVLVLGGAARRWLCVHLRMTGRLHVAPVLPEPAELPLRLAVELDRGWLLFGDPRRFGTVRLHRTRSAARPVGVEPLSRGFTAARLGDLIAGSRTPIKPWLLRQDRVVGLGNIYASEILFAARLAPDRPAGSLDPADWRRLHRSIRRVLRAAIDACGTTFSDFQDARGGSGGYGRYLAVYGREGDPCRACGGAIRRTVQQQRATFSCPRCQR